MGPILTIRPECAIACTCGRVVKRIDQSALRMTECPVVFDDGDAKGGGLLSDATTESWTHGGH